VWFCGDQFVTDIQGSSAVGMTPVWYKGALRYDSECKLTEGIEIYGWNELIDIIKSL
jgi:FMN phosphatase YigB (HAD superfamily)